jgi:branched-chain amino acid transport system ATP-binding protein
MEKAMDALLEVHAVSKTFGGVVANRDVSLAVPAGSIVGLIGPNGSGKTTLFASIVGAHPVDSGTIRFGGHDITRLRVGQIARLGLIRTYQQTRVYRDMNCVRNMQISAPLKRNPARAVFAPFPAEVTERAEALLDFVGLYEKRHLRAGSLSFGQQKLLEFAMALISEPKMLLLDEPTAGINPTLINALLERLREANTRFGVTLLVIEHNMRAIMHLASRLYCLAHGQLLASGTPDEIQRNPQVLEAYLGAH